MLVRTNLENVLKRYSSYDGSELPKLWSNATAQVRMALGHAIRNDLSMPSVWFAMSLEERRAVKNHVLTRRAQIEAERQIEKMGQYAAMYSMGKPRLNYVIEESTPLRGGYRVYRPVGSPTNL